MCCMRRLEFFVVVTLALLVWLDRMSGCDDLVACVEKFGLSSQFEHSYNLMSLNSISGINILMNVGKDDSVFHHASPVIMV